MELTIEHQYTCPHCGELISAVIDTSVDGQEYVEDCQVCCRPIAITYAASPGQVSSFSAEPTT